MAVGCDDLSQNRGRFTVNWKMELKVLACLSTKSKKKVLTQFFLVNSKNITFMFQSCPSSRSGDPPWILKRVGLKSSGQRQISLNSNTMRIAFI